VVCHYLSLKKFALITHPHSSSTKLPLISLSALVLTTSTWLFLQAFYPLPTPLRELQLPVPSQRDTFAHPKITKTLIKTEHINFPSFRSLPLLNQKHTHTHTHTHTLPRMDQLLENQNYGLAHIMLSIRLSKTNYCRRSGKTKSRLEGVLFSRSTRSERETETETASDNKTACSRQKDGGKEEYTGQTRSLASPSSPGVCVCVPPEFCAAFVTWSS
jgi:hypothetical protein